MSFKTIWRRAQESKLESFPGASPSSASSAMHPGAAAPQDSQNTPAAVSQGITIKGEISGHGDLFLDGLLEGKIRITSGTFTVGPNAMVRAEIEAPEIIIRGDVIGTLHASERVHICSTGKIMGDIETRGIVIDDGAVLHGTVATPQVSERQVTAPAVPVNEIDHPPQASDPEILWRAKGAGSA
jgi:cytoskeletal protein CcmA (bactofilin family)